MTCSTWFKTNFGFAQPSGSSQEAKHPLEGLWQDPSRKRCCMKPHACSAHPWTLNPRSADSLVPAQGQTTGSRRIGSPFSSLRVVILPLQQHFKQIRIIMNYAKNFKCSLDQTKVPSDSLPTFCFSELVSMFSTSEHLVCSTHYAQYFTRRGSFIQLITRDAMALKVSKARRGSCPHRPHSLTKKAACM